LRMGKKRTKSKSATNMRAPPAQRESVLLPSVESTTTTTSMPNEEDKTAEETEEKSANIRALELAGDEKALLDLIREKEEQIQALLRVRQRQSNVAASAAEQMPTPSQIDVYLSRNVKAVPLPKIFKNRETFAPLILDGASGVGKTQQAFALLQCQYKLIYLNLTVGETEIKDQRINEEMSKLVDLEAIFQTLPKAMDQVLAFTCYDDTADTDRFSKDALRERLCLLFDFPELDGLKALVEALQKSQLEYKHGKLHPVPTQELTDRRMYNIFDGVVLFIDDALPKSATTGADHLKLCFLANLGRAMGMRVVLVATAVAAAKLTSEIQLDRQASRFGRLPGEECVEIIFFWQDIEEKTLDTILPKDLLEKTTCSDHQVLKTAIRNERPLMAVLIGEVLLKCTSSKPVELMTVLKSVGEELRTRKKNNVSQESHLIWLTGHWLDGAYHVPVGLRMRVPELVHSHFFEPSIAVDSEDCPLFESGLCAWTRRSGPLRLGVHTVLHGEKTLCSVTVNDGMGLLPEQLSCASITTQGSRDVERCLRNCTQQCLSREPLLAIALSTIDVIDATSFQKIISKKWCQSLSQRAAEAVDGESYEPMFFAAIQLASHSKGFKLCDIVDFIKEVRRYICQANEETTGTLELPDEILETLRLSSNYETVQNTDTENLEWHKYSDRLVPQTDITKVFANYKIPWLVPASSKEKLLHLPSVLFGNVRIAGLVPTEEKTEFFAQAFELRPSEAADWVFDFFAHADYSLNVAVEELETKCEINDDAKVCHAMLIAVTKNSRSQAAAWRVQSKSGIDLFRIAIVFGET